MPRKNRRKSEKGNQLLKFPKANPQEDLRTMEEAGELSLTALDCLIIEDAVEGEKDRNTKATGVYRAIKSPKIA